MPEDLPRSVDVRPMRHHMEDLQAIGFTETPSTSGIRYISLYLISGIVNLIFIAHFPEIGYMQRMPSEKPKVLFVIDRELLERVEDYRFENRINNRSEAIRRLLELGLAAVQEKPSQRSPKRGRD